MNNVIRLYKPHYTQPMYAVFDRSIDRYKSFGYQLKPRKQMNYMLVRVAIYAIPVDVGYQIY